MAALDRTLALCDLLLGAAHADAHMSAGERDAVREMLTDLHGEGGLPAEVEARIAGFDPAAFTVAEAARPFASDSPDEKRRLLHLVAAVHDADDELDLAEDAYLRALAGALGVPESELGGLVVEVEVEELKRSYDAVRKRPPPVPGGAGA